MDQRVQEAFQEKATHERKLESEVPVNPTSPGQDIQKEETMVGRLGVMCYRRI